MLFRSVITGGELPGGAYVVIAGNSDPIYKRLMLAIGRADLAEAPEFAHNDGRAAKSGLLDAAITHLTSSQFCADLPLPTHLPATRYAPLAGEVIAITNAGSGLTELLTTLEPPWCVCARSIAAGVAATPLPFSP